MQGDHAVASSLSWHPPRRLGFRAPRSEAKLREPSARGFATNVRHRSVQSMITLPEWPDRAAAKAASWSRNEKRWVIAGRMSSPDWSMTDILYHVSYISRP